MRMRMRAGWLRVLVGMLGVCGVCDGLAGPDANLALNPGFEQVNGPAGEELPADWGFYTSSKKNVGIVGNIFRSGRCSLKVTSPRVADAHMGLVQELAVTPGKAYTFAAYVINDRSERLDGTFEGSLGIEWANAEGSEIGRDDSAPRDKDLSRLRWTVVSITATAPPLAARGKFVVRALEKEKPKGGACYIDDVSIVER